MKYCIQRLDVGGKGHIVHWFNQNTGQFGSSNKYQSNDYYLIYKLSHIRYMMTQHNSAPQHPYLQYKIISSHEAGFNI